MQGDNYQLSRMDVVRFVDENYPDADVGPDGRWRAVDNPRYRPAVGETTSDAPVVVFSSDREYYPGLVVSLFSFRDHHPGVHTVILDCGLSHLQVDYLSQFAEMRRAGDHLPGEPAWARFEVSLLPYERVVYLDSDIVVLKSLDDLLNTDAEFAAVPDADLRLTDNFSSPTVLEKYAIDPDSRAFFAGGFSLDNRIWGGGRLLEEAMRVHGDVGSSFLYADQSALQVIMHSRKSVTFLDSSYNAIAALWDWDHRAEEARVIHYAGDAIKPWNPLCEYPGLDHFFGYSKIVRDVTPDAFRGDEPSV